MPYTKEMLVRQAVECQSRVRILLDLKKDVNSCIDAACNRISDEIPKILVSAETADAGQLKNMFCALRNARKLVKDYEESLEQVRLIYEDDDLDFDVQSIIEPMAAMPLPSAGTNGLLPNSHPPNPMPRSVPLVSGNIQNQPLVPVITDRGGGGEGRSMTLGNESRSSSILVQSQGPDSLVDSLMCLPVGSNGITDPISSMQMTDPVSNGTGIESPIVAGVPSVLVPLDNPVIGTSDFEVAVAMSLAVEPEQAAAQITASSGIDEDYRKLVVGKGNGNLEHHCQRSVDLISARTEPLRCMLSHAENPSLFWIQLYTNNVINIEDEMNAALERGEETLPMLNPRVGDYCIAPVEEDQDMHRAKILKIKDNTLGTLFSKVLYIDTGKTDWVATKALLAMPRRSRHYPRQACPCVLADLEPANGSWNQETINAFRDLCATDDSTQLYVKAFDKSDLPDVNTVFLYRGKNNNAENLETILISMIRLTKGQVRRAERLVPMKAFENENGNSVGTRDPPEVQDGWRCTVRVLERDDEDEDEIAVAEAAQESERAAAKEALRVMVERNAPDFVAANRIAQKGLAELANPVDNMIYFRVTEAVSAGDFYIQVCDSNGRNDQLAQLIADMITFYSIPANQSLLSNFQVPHAAVARFTRDGVTSYRRVMITQWQTPRDLDSKDIRLHSTMTAIFVDDGYCEQRIEAKNVFRLERRFAALPAQAAYCKLYECHPKSSSEWDQSGWDQSSCEIFRELTIRGKPLMKAVICSQRQPYELVMYRFEPNGGDFTCINQKMVESNGAVSDMIWSQ